MKRSVGRVDSAGYSLIIMKIFLFHLDVNKVFPSHPDNDRKVDHIDTSSENPKQKHAAVFPAGNISIRFSPNVIKL